MQSAARRRRLSRPTSHDLSGIGGRWISARSAGKAGRPNALGSLCSCFSSVADRSQLPSRWRSDPPVVGLRVHRARG